MAAAGVDASNVAAGSVVLLPVDPDASARPIRAAVRERTGANVGVVVTDTAGRAWREGRPTSRSAPPGCWSPRTSPAATDAHGNPLAVTEPAVADELAGAAELARASSAAARSRSSAAAPTWCCRVGEDGPGAAALVRAEGARPVRVRRPRGRPAGAARAGQRVFGSPLRGRAGRALRSLAPEADVDADGDGLVVRAPTPYAGSTARRADARVRARLVATDDAAMAQPGDATLPNSGFDGHVRRLAPMPHRSVWPPTDMTVQPREA